MSTKGNLEYSNQIQNNEDDYDPHLHRVLSHPNTSPETLLHILKGCLGTGILAMPEAFKFAGFLNGLFSTILIGIFNTHCVHILVRSQYVICKKRRRAVVTYSESMQLGIEMGPACLRKLTKYASHITDTVLILFQIGVCCVYILFVAENIREVTNYYIGKDIALGFYILMCFVPFLLIASVKNLKIFAPFSLAGNIVCLLTYGVIAYHVSHKLTPFRDLKLFGSYFEYPLFFGTAMFSLQSITVTVLAESNMAKPMDFGLVFNTAMFIITVLYIFVGTLGYWRYANEIKSSITLNFPITSYVGQTVRILYSFTVFISYGLNVLVPVKFFWKSFMEKPFGDSSEHKKLVLEYLIRFACAIITFGLAASVPFLGLVISFIGNVFLTCLMFIFPPLLEICAYWPDELGTRRWRLWKNIIIIIIATIVFSAGTYSIINEIVSRYSK